MLIPKVTLFDWETALEFLQSNEILPRNVKCVCQGETRLAYKKNRGIKRLVYICRKNNCKKEKSIFSATIFSNTKLTIVDFLDFIFFYLNRSPYHQLRDFCKISDSTIARNKFKLIQVFDQILRERESPIGGQGIRVQVDETVICRNNKLKYPSGRDDQEPNTIWLVGGIEELNPKKFFLKRVVNRQSTTIKPLLENQLLPGTILITDGYPTYPSVANDLDFTHITVNHSKGFKNDDGDTTNIIEAFWSPLKRMLRIKSGTPRNRLNEFVTDFLFFKTFLPTLTREDKENAFILVLKKIFKE